MSNGMMAATPPHVALHEHTDPYAIWDHFDAASPARALVVTVNCVGVMGKGIALAAKRRWPAMFSTYRAWCAHGELYPGEVSPWQSPLRENVLLATTKQHWQDYTDIAWVEAIASRLGSLACNWNSPVGAPLNLFVPALGCANGGLDYAEVRPLLLRAFENLPPNVNVNLYGVGSVG